MTPQPTPSPLTLEQIEPSDIAEQIVSAWDARPIVRDGKAFIPDSHYEPLIDSIAVTIRAKQDEIDKLRIRKVRIANSDGQWSAWHLTTDPVKPHSYREVVELTAEEVIAEHAELCTRAEKAEDALLEQTTRGDTAESLKNVWKVKAEQAERKRAEKHNEARVEWATEALKLRTRAENAEAEMKRIAASYGVSILHERCLQAERERDEALDGLKPLQLIYDWHKRARHFISPHCPHEVTMDDCRRAKEIIDKLEKK